MCRVTMCRLTTKYRFSLDQKEIMRRTEKTPMVNLSFPGLTFDPKTRCLSDAGTGKFCSANPYLGGRVTCDRRYCNAWEKFDMDIEPKGDAYLKSQATGKFCNVGKNDFHCKISRPEDAVFNLIDMADCAPGTVWADRGPFQGKCVANEAIPKRIKSQRPVGAVAVGTVDTHAYDMAMEAKQANPNLTNHSGTHVCDSDYIFVRDVDYVQHDMQNNMSYDAAQEECAAKAHDDDFFIQRHSNGHVVCGVYTKNNMQDVLQTSPESFDKTDPGRDGIEGAICFVR